MPAAWDWRTRWRQRYWRTRWQRPGIEGGAGGGLGLKMEVAAVRGLEMEVPACSKKGDRGGMAEVAAWNKERTYQNRERKRFS